MFYSHTSFTTHGRIDEVFTGCSHTAHGSIGDTTQHTDIWRAPVGLKSTFKTDPRPLDLCASLLVASLLLPCQELVVALAVLGHVSLHDTKAILLSCPPPGRVDLARASSKSAAPITASKPFCMDLGIKHFEVCEAIHLVGVRVGIAPRLLGGCHQISLLCF